MSKRKEESKRVEFVFQPADDFKIAHVNGVWGGMTPRGELVCNFFFEYTKIPDKEIRFIDTEGKLTGKRIRKPSKPIVIRELRTGISLAKEQAISVANWILEQIKQFEQLQKETKPEVES